MEFYLDGNGDQALPFELQAFEVPLAAAVRMFESETNTLEGKLLPSLERLTAKVSCTTISSLAVCTIAKLLFMASMQADR